MAAHVSCPERSVGKAQAQAGTCCRFAHSCVKPLLVSVGRSCDPHVALNMVLIACRGALKLCVQVCHSLFRRLSNIHYSAWVAASVCKESDVGTALCTGRPTDTGKVPRPGVAQR